MYHSIKSQHAFECDACGDGIELEDADFTSAWVTARRKGWRANRVGAGWQHLCPDCSGQKGEDNDDET